MRILLLSTFVIFMLASCKKKAETIASANSSAGTTGTTSVTPQTDTVKPLSYYPSFPGSWWAYDIKVDTSIENVTLPSYSKTISTSPAYVFYKYFAGTSSPTNPPHNFDSAYVPMVAGVAVFGYRHFLAENDDSYAYHSTSGFYPFLTEITGPCNLIQQLIFTSSRLPGYNPYDYVNMITKSVNNQGDSMITATGQASYNILGGPDYFNPRRWATTRIYVKNVGLTFYSRVNTGTNDTIECWRLSSHYIAPH